MPVYFRRNHIPGDYAERLPFTVLLDDVAGGADNVVVVRRSAQPVSEPADTGRTVPGGVVYISGQDQKWWPAAAGIAADGSNHAGFTVLLKVIFLLNITRKSLVCFFSGCYI